MPLLSDLRAALALPLAAAVACGIGAPAPAPAPIPISVAARPSGAPPLPDVPLVDGPLVVKVQYPSPNQQITSRDSNFIFGSIGSGRATLTVNGVPARVYNNGAFMVYLANPPVSAPRYDLVAARGADTARATLNIRLVSTVARAPTPAPEPLPRKPENLPT